MYASQSKSNKRDMGNSSCFKTVNIMIEKILPLKQAREIALKKTKEILKEIGVKENDKFYAIKQYEMQFQIYHSIKSAMDLNSK